MSFPRGQDEGQSDRPEKQPLGRLRVLVVEDHVGSAEAMTALLEFCGHEVLQARDGPSAVDQAGRSNPDVVLLDINLPGFDGYEVAQRLKGLSPDRPPLVVAVSGRGPGEGRWGNAGAGIDLYLTKPADPVKLLELLERFRRVVS